MSFAENLTIHEDEKYATLSINPEIFSLEVIYSASYTFLDRAYFVFDGDPGEEIQVKMKPKHDNVDLEELGLKLQNELLNYSVYVIQASRNQDVRNAIIKKALATNGVDLEEARGQASKTNSSEPEQLDRDDTDAPIGPSDDSDYVDDPDGIAETWTPDKAENLSAPGEEDGDDGLNDPDDISEPWTPDKAPEDEIDDSEREDLEEEEDEESGEGKEAGNSRVEKEGDDDIRVVAVEQDACIGCGVCTNLAPAVFEMEKGVSRAKKQEVTDRVREAADSCPVQSIEIEEN